MKVFSNLLLLCFSFLLIPKAQAQFTHGAGVGYVTGFGKIPADADPSVSTKPFLGAYYLSYYPRYQLTSGDYNSLTLGMPMNIGYASTNSPGNSGYYLELPLLIEANAGAGSTPNDDSFLGYGLGLGFAYVTSGAKYVYYTPNNSITPIEQKITSYGPMAQINFRFAFNEKTVSFRSAYKMGLNDLKYNLFYVAVHMLF